MTPEAIETGIKPVCDVLNAIPSVRTVWSCEGHPERPMRPYVCFTAPVDVAFKLDRLLGRGRGGDKLQFNWWLTAHFTDDGSLRYVIEPNDYRIVGETPSWFRLFRSCKWDKDDMNADLQSLAVLFAQHKKLLGEGEFIYLDGMADAKKTEQQQAAKSKTPAWIIWLRCVLVRGGHSYGRWWWPDRDEAHCFCDECADMRTPKNRRSWLHRERVTNASVTDAN